MRRIVITDAKQFKRPRQIVPSVWRYWTFAGLARHWDRDLVEVQTYGPALPGFDMVVLARRPRPVGIWEAQSVMANYGRAMEQLYVFTEAKPCDA